MLVDAQVHVWAAETPGRPWEPGSQPRAHRATPFGPEELLGVMDAAGVDRAFLVAPGWEGPRNDLVTAAARAHPDRFAALARFPLDRPLRIDQLADLVAAPGVLGVRAVFLREAAGWLTDGTADWLWPVAAELGVPVCVLAPGQHAALDRVARTHPGLRLVLDHLGVDPAVRDGDLTDAVTGTLSMSERPGVAVKASALPIAVADVEGYPFPSLHRPLRAVLAAYGAERVFWGSDLTRSTCTYAEARDLFAEALGLDDRTRDEVLGAAVCRWFGWPPAPTQIRPE